MPGTSCSTKRLTVPPTFCFNFFKHLEEQKRGFDHGKSLTITAGLQRLSSVWGETLQGPDTCMQKESKIERKREMRQQDEGGERQRHETENGKRGGGRGVGAEQIFWVFCLGGFQQPNKRTNTKRGIFTSNPVLHPDSISQPNKQPHTQRSEKEGHAQPLYTLKKWQKET